MPFTNPNIQHKYFISVKDLTARELYLYNSLDTTNTSKHVTNKLFNINSDTFKGGIFETLFLHTDDILLKNYILYFLLIFQKDFIDKNKLFETKHYEVMNEYILPTLIRMYPNLFL